MMWFIRRLHHAGYYIRLFFMSLVPILCISMDATARIESERMVAEESGFSTLSQLDEQLLATSSRLDRAKQQLYFPEAKGYR